MTEPDAIYYARVEEQLRQEIASFDQLMVQDARSFAMRQSLCWVSIALMPVIVAICVFILIYSAAFPAFVVKAASATLFGDVVGNLVMIWKLIVAGGGARPLAPVTVAIPSPKAPTAGKNASTKLLGQDAG